MVAEEIRDFTEKTERLCKYVADRMGPKAKRTRAGMTFSEISRLADQAADLTVMFDRLLADRESILVIG